VSGETIVTQERWGRSHLWKQRCGNIRIHAHHIHFTQRVPPADVTQYDFAVKSFFHCLNDFLALVLQYSQPWWCCLPVSGHTSRPYPMYCSLCFSRSISDHLYKEKSVNTNVLNSSLGIIPLCVWVWVCVCMCVCVCVHIHTYVCVCVCVCVHVYIHTHTYINIYISVYVYIRVSVCAVLGSDSLYVHAWRCEYVCVYKCTHTHI